MQADKGEVVDQMGQLLEEAGMRDVLPLPKARVPVVKFVVPDTNTKVRVLHIHDYSSVCIRLESYTDMVARASLRAKCGHQAMLEQENPDSDALSR